MENKEKETLVFEFNKNTDFIVSFFKSNDFKIPLLAAFASVLIDNMFVAFIVAFMIFVSIAKREHNYVKKFVVFVIIRILLVPIFGHMDGYLLLEEIIFYPLLSVLLLLTLFYAPVADFKRVRRKMHGGKANMAQDDRYGEGPANTNAAEIEELKINSGRVLVKFCLKSKRFVSMLVLVLCFMPIVIFMSFKSIQNCNDEMCGIIVLFAMVGSVIISFPAIFIAMLVATRKFKKSVLSLFLFSMIALLSILMLVITLTILLASLRNYW